MDWIINDEMGLTVGHVLGWAAASAMVIGGVIPYVPQYLEIKKTQDAEGFSLHVCFALLIANSLRILFWFSKRYELPLLVQSVVMNITMFLMIHLCVKVKRVNANNKERAFLGDDLRLPKAAMTDTDTAASVSISTEVGPLKRARSRHYLSDLDFKYFWSWTDFQSYLDFMLVVWAVGAAITYLMLSIDWFMETVGFVAVFTEAMLGAPQFVRNFKNKSTYGMSIHMVLMWTLGDMFKTGYFIVRKAPSQFWICGTLQQFAPEEQQQQTQSQLQQQSSHTSNNLNNNNSDSASQSIPNTISSGSGDDHLLTAHADDDDFNRNYHDNRAFQYHNNNSLNRRGGKNLPTKDDDKDKVSGLDVLDVVIVHKGYRNLKEEVDLANNVCSCKQQILTTQLVGEPRKRHNATQTPTSLINWAHSSAERRSRKSVSPNHCLCMMSTSKGRDCYNCTEVQRCQHHCQHTVTPTSQCCCSATRHPHHYPRHQHAAIMPASDKSAAATAITKFGHLPVCAKYRSFKRHKRCSSGRHYRPPHVYHLYKKHCSSASHLPNTCTKSSLDSSDDQNQRLSSSGTMQEIAIEIDAATMTEDNTTTATSNFAFKVAADSALAPIIRAPIHIDSDDGGRGKHLKRRSSLNSNTTIETDELSNDGVIDSDMRSRCYCHCCDHARTVDAPKVVRPIQNECVKIKRKRFIAADDCCSSCSRCSSCSCSNVHSSSCSSFEEWPLDGRHSVRSDPHDSHAFTVSADCHRCHLQRQNSQTSTEDVEGKNHTVKGKTEPEVQPLPLVQETTDSSARTSRRSSVSISFCSCNSNTCCYCSGSCEDSHTGHMCTARDATIASLTLGKLGPFEGEEGHSSTLTPLTNPSSVASTPGDEGDVTIRSLSNAFSEDTSSQSHSAEYFSLSSTNQISQGTPRKLPTYNKILPTSTADMSTSAARKSTDQTANMISEEDDTNGQKVRKVCKHYSKHHRHKSTDSPVDSYL